MISRREALGSLAALLASLTACGSAAESEKQPNSRSPEGSDLPPEAAFSDNVDALFDVLIPAERDAKGKLVSPGAREAGANEVLALDRFAALAVALGLVPQIDAAGVARLEELGGLLRTTLDAQLDVLATVERPGTRFRDLPRTAQERIVARALPLDPLMQVVRAAAFTAYLGAVTSDVGHVAIGYPAFERLADGLAVSGYPRKVDGKIDDYTYNALPAGANADLSLLLDANGDLR